MNELRNIVVGDPKNKNSNKIIRIVEKILNFNEQKNPTPYPTMLYTSNPTRALNSISKQEIFPFKLNKTLLMKLQTLNET